MLHPADTVERGPHGDDRRGDRRSAHVIARRSILALFLIATTPPGPLSCAASDVPASSRLAGRWEGTIQSDDGPVAFSVDLAQLETGEWVGEIDIPVQGAEDFPLLVRPTTNGVVWEVAVDVPERPRFEATFTEEPDRLLGSLFTGDAEHSISLRRIGDAEIASLDDAGRPLEVRALADDAGQLRDAFNAASDAVRLVVLLSPT